MFKFSFVILLKDRQTKPKILNQLGKQEEATGINGESTGTTATRTKVEKTREQSQHNKGHKMSVKTLRFNTNIKLN